MVHRLKTTGFLTKDLKPIPERTRLIEAHANMLLSNPDSSSTYQTIINSPDPTWMVGLLNAVHPNNDNLTVNDLKFLIRNKIFEHNKNISIDTNWFKPIDINELDTSIFDTDSKYSAPEVILPGLFSNVVPVVEEQTKKEKFDMKNLGRQGTDTYKEATVYKLAKNIPKIYRNLTVDENGDLTELGEIINRVTSGQGAKELGVYARSSVFTYPLWQLNQFLLGNPIPPQLVTLENLGLDDNYELIEQDDGTYQVVRKETSTPRSEESDTQ